MLAACLCFKDSARYLDEWLRFHYVQGFRRFFLYDNESSDDRAEVLQPWVDAGLVEWIPFPGLGKRQEIYDDCIRRAQGHVRWLAFLDDDEFLFPSHGGMLPEVLENYSKYAGVAVSWVLFGSAGHMKGSSQPVLERFQRSSGYPDQHVKCVVRPERVMRSKVIGHMFEPAPGCFIVDEKARRLDEPVNPVPSVDVLRINHYLIKSWEEWRARRSRPEANTGVVKALHESSWREWDREWSAVVDASAVRYLSAMADNQGGPRRCDGIS